MGFDTSRAATLVARSTLCDIPRGTSVAWKSGTFVQLSDAWHNRSEGCVYVIGAFDGVHVGHRELIAAAHKDAKRRGLPLAIVTFDPDPSAVLAAAEQPSLLSQENRVACLASLGSGDAIVTLRFDQAMATTSYVDFLTWVLPALAPVRAVHVGADFRLGAGGAGDVAALSAVGLEHGFEVFGHVLSCRGGQTVSASRIRGLIADGDVTGAAELLCREHFVSGHVIHGRGEGTGFGFPTANVTCDESLLLPAEGVYGGYLRRGDEAWPAAINVGAPRTFSASQGHFLEANLIGFDGDLYDESVDVVFCEWLRAPRTFSSTEQLETTVMGNIDWVRQNLGDGTVEVMS